MKEVTFPENFPSDKELEDEDRRERIFIPYACGVGTTEQREKVEAILSQHPEWISEVDLFCEVNDSLKELCTKFRV